MTQLLRGLLGSTFLAILVFLLVLLFSRPDPQPVEKEECPFAQEDYIYWSKKYQLAWCKVTCSYRKRKQKNYKPFPALSLSRYQRPGRPRGCSTCWSSLKVTSSTIPPLDSNPPQPTLSQCTNPQRDCRLLKKLTFLKMIWCTRSFEGTTQFQKTSTRLKNRLSLSMWWVLKRCWWWWILIKSVKAVVVKMIVVKVVAVGVEGCNEWWWWWIRWW